MSPRGVSAPASTLKLAGLALDAVCREPDIETILDIGSGAGLHAECFREAGKTVTTIDLAPPADYVGAYPKVGPHFSRPFDCLWASHVLEHQTNVGDFLETCFRQLRAPTSDAAGGLFAVTVPPEKPQLVGGHLTTWTPGRLLYNLILAGFDCAEARVRCYGYNISVLVRKRRAELPALAMDKGDIERLAPFFPVPVQQGCDGRFDRVNWP